MAAYPRYPIALSRFENLIIILLIQNSSHTAFQFLCVALAIDTIDGRGLSKEACRELLPR